MYTPSPRAHMRARDKFLQSWKDENGRCQPIGKRFSYFVKKLRIEKPDGKLMEMVSPLLRNVCLRKT